MNSPYFPMGYQPQSFQQFQQPQFQQPQQNNGIIWVQGEAGAKSFLVGPNQTVQLWDSEADTIYLKSADASGMPSLKVLDYTIRGTQNAQETPKQDAYVTKDDLYALEEKILKKLDILAQRGAENE